MQPTASTIVWPRNFFHNPRRFEGSLYLFKNVLSTHIIYLRCLSDDKCVCIVILTIPDSCQSDSDEEVAKKMFDLIVNTQSQINYPQAVIELLSQSLKTGIVEAEVCKFIIWPDPLHFS